MNGRLLLFSLSELHYALPLASVDRIVPSVEVTPLPGAPEIVEGVINLAGKIVPIFNIRSRFGLPAKALALTDRIILAHTEKRRVGLIADSIGEVVECEKIIEPECIHPGLEHIGGIARIGEDLVLIQDLEAFLSGKERMQLDLAMECT